MQPNNPVGADCLETSVVLLRLLASAQLERYTESVFNSMINCQSNLKNPLPSPHCCDKKQLSPDSDRKRFVVLRFVLCKVQDY